MHVLLAALRAAAEPTRLRILALAARGSFCVVDFTEILGQSQPRLSRHLRLLVDAGLLERVREGANVWFALAPPDAPRGALTRSVLDHLPTDDPTLASDRRAAARVLAERVRVTSEDFRRRGVDWDEMHTLGLPADAVETVLLQLLPAGPLGRMLDIGTGTGRLLELLAPRIATGLGIDASRAMLALARARLARPRLDRPHLDHCVVRLGDMYHLALPDAAFDLVTVQMVLHYAEDPAAVLAEAARVLRPGGRVVVIDLAAHARSDVMVRLAHRWPGFEDSRMAALFAAAGLAPAPPAAVPALPTTRDAAARPFAMRPLAIRLWPALRAMQSAELESAR